MIQGFISFAFCSKFRFQNSQGKKTATDVVKKLKLTVKKKVDTNQNRRKVTLKKGILVVRKYFEQKKTKTLTNKLQKIQSI